MRASSPRTLEFICAALLAALVCMFAALPAIAQEDDEEEASDYAREGWYLQGSGVHAAEKWAGSISDVGAEDTWGFDLRAGSRISPWASVEVELEILGDFLSDSRQDLSVVHAGVSTRIYPLGGMLGRTQPFGIAGLGIVSTVVEHRDRTTDLRQSNADWGFRGGGGVDLYYTEHIALSVEGAYVWTVGDVENIDHVAISIGLMYRF
ncbi:MAG: porin family protein [Myxococcota bacterium]|jgi:opacity protein-like surface antigen|nr:porin family protein [Myxococcota bacterium]